MNNKEEHEAYICKTVLDEIEIHKELAHLAREMKALGEDEISNMALDIMKSSEGFILEISSHSAKH